MTADRDESVATHLHPGEAEALIILEGDVELHGAHGVTILGPGDIVYIPPDSEHGLRTPTVGRWRAIWPIEERVSGTRGTYATQPFAGPGGLCVGESSQAGCIEAGAEDDSIRITLTLPDGWKGIEGWAVVPSVEGYSPPGGAWLLFMRGGWLYSKPCSGPGPDIPTGTTVHEFVTALVNHPDLDVTSPVDVTLAGYSGKYLELRAPANIATDQPPKPGECNGYFVWEPGIYAQGPNDLWRIWVLDVDGVRVVVRSDTFPGTTPQVQAQLAAIVDSIRIER